MAGASEQASAHPPSEAGFLARGGEMGALMRSFHWSQSALGPTGSWPQSLRSALSVCLESSFQIAIYWGPELALLYNDPWSAILGNKHPWALGRPGQEVWPEIWDTIGPLFDQVLSRGEATLSKDQLLAMHRRGFTEECYFDYTFSPIRDERGGVGGIFNIAVETTFRVISERRTRLLKDLGELPAQARSSAEACTLTAEALASDAADLPFCLVYLADPDNSGHGMQLAASVGLRAGSSASPSRIDPASSASPWPLSQALATRSAVVVDDLRNRFGMALPGGPWPEACDRALVVPLPALGGAAAGVLVAGVSPRLALDAEYEAFVERVAGLTAAAIANARAYEEERRRAEALAELDRAKTAFSNISHEFRTPLTLMLGPLEELLAMDGALPPVAQELASVTHRNGLRLQKLVNTLLDFSRIEAGRAQASYEPTDLATLTAELASSFRSAMEKAGLHLVVECPPLSEPVWVDGDMWEKVVLNLLSNAFKYTLQGQVAVRLEESGRHAVLSVADTGVGIPEHELPRLFERFHHVEGARGRTLEGTGIGLALVAELVKLHGGVVEVQSAVGAGSTFRVSLPLGTGHLPQDRVAAARAGRSTATPAASYVAEAAFGLPEPERAATALVEASGTSDTLAPPAPEPASQGRVLLADDNADMRAYVRRLLAGHFDVEAVADGAEALTRALADPPDLVLTDIMMPERDGFGLLQALRANPRTSTIPVILLSARAGVEARSEGMDAGADDYLVKPFGARELLARVGAHLRLARARKEAEQHATRILESITDAFVAFDREWRFTYANAEAERLNGMRREEMLGRNHWEVFPATVGTVVEREYRRAVSERVPVEFDNHFEPWNRWYHVKAYPAPDGGLSVFYEDITDRKQAEAALRRWEHIFSHAGWAVAAADPRTNVLTLVNPAFAAMHGYTVEEMTGMPLASTFAPEERDLLPQHAAAAHEQGDYVYESRHIRKDGTRFPVLTHATAFRDGAGRVLYRAATFQDITERKRAEEAQLRRNRQLDLLARVSQELVLGGKPEATTLQAVFDGMRDVLGMELYFSYLVGSEPGTLQLVSSGGLTPEQKNHFATIRFGEYLCGTVAERRERLVVENLQECGFSEAGALCAAGVTCYAGFPLLAHGHLVGTVAFATRARDRFHDGEIRMVQSVCDQVAATLDRVRLFEAVRDSEERLRTLTAAIPQLIWRATPDGAVDYLSEQWAGYFGLPPESLYGGGWEQVVHPDDLPRTLRDWTHSLQAGEPLEVKHRFRHRTGAWRWQLVRGLPVRDAAGRIIQWVGTCTDIQGEVDAEAAVRQREGQFRLFIETAPAAIAMFDREMRYLAVSRRFLEDFRLDGQGILGRSHYDVFPEIPEHWKEVHRRCLAGAVERSDEDSFLRQDGALEWLRWELQPWYDGQGEVGGLVLASELVTERKQATEALRAGRERLQAALEASGTGTFRWDVQTDALTWDEALDRLFGLAPGEGVRSLGQFLAHVHPQDRQGVTGQCARCRAEGSDFDMEFRVVWPDGGERWLYGRGRTLRDGQGRPAYMTGACVDVTERRRAEEAVRQSEERFRAAVQANSSLLWTNSARGEMEGEQPGWGGFTGQTRDEYQGYGWSKAVHPDDAQPTIDAWNEAVAARRMFSFEHRVRRRDGAWRLCSIRALPVLDEHGAIREWVGVHNDITEERSLLEALQQSEARFRQLADSMPQMVWTARADGHFDYFNERWHEFTGLRRGGASPNGWKAILHPEDVEHSDGAWRASVQSGEPFHVEFRFWDARESRWRWFLGRALPVRNDAGLVEKWFGTCTDIDQQKRVETELRRANQDLEQFAYSASHDLQEPLRNVSVYSQLLQRRYGPKLDPQAQGFLGYLVEGAQRMSLLVTDLLAYTQAGVLEEEPLPPVDAEQVFRRVVTALARVIQESRGSVTHDPLPSVAVKEVHLEQLLQNLIGNALKYCSDDEPSRVHVCAARRDDGWVFSVRDNGIGIAPEYHDKVFGVFKRLHAKGGRYPGTGIGLAICQKIVERYGGRIWVDSEPGRGSTFHFTVPTSREA